MGFNAGHSTNHTDMRPSSNNQRKPDLVISQLANINQLLQMGSQMLSTGNMNNKNDNNRQTSGRFKDDHGESESFYVFAK